MTSAAISTLPHPMIGVPLFENPLDIPVLTIHFVADENPENLGDPRAGLEPTNHWSLFLATGSASSVRVEVVPNAPGSPGMVVLESKRCAVTGTTPDVLEVIIAKKRDKYILAPVGEGCRFWLHTVVDDLADAGIVSRADAVETQECLAKYWFFPKGTGSVARPITKGTFFG
ncbi:uncharacterized protein BXZ73DRAFT_73105 [Epithele typhae]|uniref:uncharacterized protein n=1 Tax=Epithele typhae TaxID=378194 RepID=UPI0020072D84|nr:uncharacterized protein BXZ73DRAFT_73105 [Epithele typhae]KAH9946322.1 hypothetical protein BXZ73DRAFT_73105 [Epithele typhae]